MSEQGNTEEQGTTSGQTPPDVEVTNPQASGEEAQNYGSSTKDGPVQARDDEVVEDNEDEGTNPELWEAEDSKESPDNSV